MRLTAPGRLGRDDYADAGADLSQTVSVPNITGSHVGGPPSCPLDADEVPVFPPSPRLLISSWHPAMPSAYMGIRRVARYSDSKSHVHMESLGTLLLIGVPSAAEAIELLCSA